MIGWVVYLVLLGVYIAFWGIPFTEDTLLLWITGAVFVSCLGEPGRFRRGFLRDWFPLYVVLGLYALLRGYADHLLFNTHITPQLRFDNWIGRRACRPPSGCSSTSSTPYHLHVWDYLAWGTYLSHFFVSFLICGVLWVRDHKAFRRFVALYVTLMLSGFLTYVLYPAMPPWLASQLGYMPGSVRVVPVVWSSLGIHWAAAVFESGHRFNNDVAAVPSLHAASRCSSACSSSRRTKRVWVKVLLVLYVPAMATRARLHGRALRVRHPARVALRDGRLLRRLLGARSPRRPQGRSGPGGRGAGRGHLRRLGSSPSPGPQPNGADSEPVRPAVTVD